MGERKWENNCLSKDKHFREKYLAKKEAERKDSRGWHNKLSGKEYRRREEKETLEFLCNSSPSSPDGASSSQPGFLRKVWSYLFGFLLGL